MTAGAPSLRRVLGRLVTALAAVLAVLVTIAILGMLSTSREYRRGSQLGIARQVSADRLLEHLLAAESGSRGYVLTGRTNYLSPFRVARTSFPKDVDRLRRLVGDEGGMGALVDSAVASADRWFEESTTLVGLRTDASAASALERLNTGRAQALQQAFRLDHARLLAAIGRERRASLSRADVRRRLTLGAVVVAALLALAVVAIVARGVWRRIGGPVADIDQGVRRVAAGDLAERVQARPLAVRELGALVAGFNQMQVDLVAQREVVATAARRDAALSAERELWQTVQSGLLPSRLPRAAWMRLAAKYRPAEANLLIGGDFYDAVLLDDGRLSMVIGDVSGHGAPAAAKAAGLRFAWRTMVQVDPEPTAVLSVLNAQIGSPDERIAGRFASLLHAVVSPDGRVVLSPAGHPAPFLLTAEGCVRVEIPDPGPPLGVFDDAEWPPVTLQIPEGGTLFFYTDGIVEARRDGVAFGSRRACAVLEAERASALQERVARLIDAARRHDEHGLRDDVVVLAIERPKSLS